MTRSLPCVCVCVCVCVPFKTLSVISQRKQSLGSSLHILEEGKRSNPVSSIILKATRINHLADESDDMNFKYIVP